MNERKITSESLEGGTFHKELARHINHAGVTEQGRARIQGALSDALEHIAKKHDLSLGVGGKHMDETLDYIDTRYKGEKLKTKEREAIEHALHAHFGYKPEETEDA